VLEVLEDMNLEQDQVDKFYDTLENLGIAPVGEDLPAPHRRGGSSELEELNEIEEVTEEEIIDTESMVESFSTDDPVRMYLKRSARCPAHQ
jgi:RNA polymerase primary sigma factor